MPIRIVTDSNCDLPQDLVEEYSITVVPLYVNIGTDSYLDGVEMSRSEFYTRLPSFASHPTTSVPSPGQFYKAYSQLKEEGATQIISVHISITLSAVVNSARLAVEEIEEVDIAVVDSGQLTLGTGLQVLAAAKAAQEGHSMESILAMLRDMSRRTLCCAALDTLEFLKRSGRLTRFQSGLGSILQVKPLLKMAGGEMDMERVRTRGRATQRLIELVEELGPLQDLAVVHTHAPRRAQALWHKAKHLMPGGGPPLFSEVTPVIGAHIGPGAVGFVALRACGSDV